MHPAEVKKLPPLKCPQCGSDKVSRSFTRRVGRAFLSNGSIWCQECETVTLPDGRTKPFETDGYWAEKYGKRKLGAAND